MANDWPLGVGMIDQRYVLDVSANVFQLRRHLPKLCRRAQALLSRAQHRQCPADGSDTRALDAVFVRLLAAIANKGGGPPRDQPVPVILDLAPQCANLDRHRGVRCEQHIKRNGLSLSQEIEIALQAVGLAVDIARRILFAWRFRAARRDGRLYPLQQDVLGARQIDAFEVDIRLRRIRAVEMRAKPHLDDEIHLFVLLGVERGDDLDRTDDISIEFLQIFRRYPILLVSRATDTLDWVALQERAAN